MGLRKGVAILVYYVVGATQYQVVLLAHDSVLGKSGKHDNRLGSVLPQLSMSLRGCLLRLLNPFVAMLCIEMKRVRTLPLTNRTLGWELKALMVLC